MKRFNMMGIREKYTNLIKEKVEKIGTLGSGVLFIKPKGDDRAQSYITSKKRVLKDLGLRSVTVELDPNDSSDEFNLSELTYRAYDNGVPFLIQLPFGDKNEVITKATGGLGFYFDIDRLSITISLTNSKLYDFKLLPCTVKAVQVLISEYLGINISDKWDKNTLYGKTITVLGRGQLVGKPLVRVLQDCGANVICCCAGTSSEQIKSFVNISDIVVSAVGKHGVITSDMIDHKHKCFIIDAGVSFKDGKLQGDFKYDKDKVDEILPNVTFTPHIGGVGPMTVLSVAYNTVSILKSHPRKPNSESHCFENLVAGLTEDYPLETEID